jgi:surfactin synthase thioesterase subunit
LSWLVPFGPVDARPVLVCLPQAGSGCGAFRSWQTEFGDRVAVVGVQLPGRENRFGDPPAESFAAAVAAIVTELGELHTGQSIVLFGHSFGGLIGYEVARAVPVTALVVAASRPPHMSGKAAGSMGAGGADDVFSGLLDAKDLDEDVRELVLEVLAQDSALSATYEDPGGAPVSCPLHAWGGADDDVVTAAHLAEWRPYAGASFHQREFAGGHDFCLSQDAVHALADLISPSRQGV